jgi:hypothetical protein
MIWTNETNLPAPIASAIMNDRYHEKAMDAVVRVGAGKYGLAEADIRSGKIPHFTINQLIKPVRMRVLERRYDEKIVQDVADHIWRLFGQAMHGALARGSEPFRILEAWQTITIALKQLGVMDDELIKSALEMVWEQLQRLVPKDRARAEERLVTFLQDERVLVSGEPDLLHQDPDPLYEGGKPTLSVDDYKVIPVYSFQKGIKTEWEQQLNGYRWLNWVVRQELAGRLRIIALLRDWKRSEKVKHEYPQSAVQIMTGMPIWALEDAEAFVKARVRAHLVAEGLSDEELPECTTEEAWIKPEMFAVKREGSDRARKVINNQGQAGRDEAQAFANGLNEKLKRDKKTGELKEKPYVVEHRPGEATRCLNFCAAAPFCSQFKAYKEVAWGLSGPKEEAEEAVA